MLVKLCLIIFIAGIVLFGAWTIYQRVRIFGNKQLAAVAEFEWSRGKIKNEAKLHWQKAQDLAKEREGLEDGSKELSKLNDRIIIELKKATELDPQNPRLWYDLGGAFTFYNSTGAPENGLPAQRKAEELAPDNIIYVNGVGDLLLRAGKYDEAIVQLQKSLRLDEQSGFAHLGLGIGYRKLAIFDEAREHLEKALMIFDQKNINGKYDGEIVLVQKELAALPTKPF